MSDLCWMNTKPVQAVGKLTQPNGSAGMKEESQELGKKDNEENRLKSPAAGYQFSLFAVIVFTASPAR